MMKLGQDGVKRSISSCLLTGNGVRSWVAEVAKAEKAERKRLRAEAEAEATATLTASTSGSSYAGNLGNG